MDDLISMQDAIEAICDGIMSRFDVGVTEGYELVEDALSGLPSANPEPQWISCNERLPENYERVLTTISISNREPKVRSGCYHNGLFSNDNGDCWNSTDPEVKGWCKLPEPYKPKDGEIE